MKSALRKIFNKLGRIANFKDLLNGAKKSIAKEQKDLIFERKSKREENEYFNFMKFILSSPDRQSQAHI